MPNGYRQMRSLASTVTFILFSSSAFADSRTNSGSLIEGEWAGYGTYQQASWNQYYPLVCRTLVAKAKRLNRQGNCYIGISGDLYDLQISCNDPTLSEKGNALFVQHVQICEQISDESKTPVAEGHLLYIHSYGVLDSLEQHSGLGVHYGVGVVDSRDEKTINLSYWFLRDQSPDEEIHAKFSRPQPISNP